MIALRERELLFPGLPAFLKPDSRAFDWFFVVEFFETQKVFDTVKVN